MIGQEATIFKAKSPIWASWLSKNQEYLGLYHQYVLLEWLSVKRGILIILNALQAQN